MRGKEILPQTWVELRGRRERCTDRGDGTRGEEILPHYLRSGSSCAKERAMHRARNEIKERAGEIVGYSWSTT